MMFISSLQTHNQNPLTIEKNSSLNEFFQKLDNTSDLVKELDSISVSSSYPSLYASIMLTGGSNDLLYDWITKQMRVDNRWNDQCKESTQTKFEESLHHLSFDHRFALLVGAYRLAKLGEQNETIDAAKQSYREAAAAFKSCLIQLIQENFLTYQKLDLSTLSIKNSKVLKFDQSTISHDFLNEISQQSQSSSRRKVSLYVKTAIVGSLLFSATAGGIFLFRYSALPASSISEKTSFFGSFKEFTLFSIVFIGGSYCFRKIRKLSAQSFVNKQKKKRYYQLIDSAVKGILRTPIMNHKENKHFLIYMTQIVAFIQVLKKRFPDKIYRLRLKVLKSKFANKFTTIHNIVYMGLTAAKKARTKNLIKKKVSEIREAKHFKEIKDILINQEAHAHHALTLKILTPV